MDSENFNYSSVHSDLQCRHASARLGQHSNGAILRRQSKPQDSRGGRQRQIGRLRGIPQLDFSPQVHHTVGARVGNEDW